MLPARRPSAVEGRRPFAQTLARACGLAAGSRPSCAATSKPPQDLRRLLGVEPREPLAPARRLRRRLVRSPRRQCGGGAWRGGDVHRRLHHARAGVSSATSCGRWRDLHRPGSRTTSRASKLALLDAFRRSQAAARDGEPIVFVLSQEDLLGQRGAPAAILANALLSGMRTLAAERSRGERRRGRRRRRPRGPQTTGSRSSRPAAASPGSCSRACGARGQAARYDRDRHRRRRAGSAAPSPTGCSPITDVLRVDLAPSAGGIRRRRHRPGRPRARSSQPSTARSTCWSTTPASRATRGS